MLDICSGCHARSFCQAELDKSDQVLKKTNCVANDIAGIGDKLQKNGKMSEEDMFWLFRNEVPYSDSGKGQFPAPSSLSCLPIPGHYPYILTGCIDNLEFEVKPKGMDIQLESFYSYPG